MLLPLADVSSPGPFAVVMAVGFIVGTYGHVAKSRTLVLTGIIVIAFVSLYFVVESQAGHPLPFP